MGAGAGGRLTLWLVALAVLVASGATGIVVSRPRRRPTRSRPLELDLEYDPYTATDHTNQCYGLSPARLVAWIGAFIREAERAGGQAPVIYTSAAWWRACTGDSAAFSADPL